MKEVIIAVISAVLGAVLPWLLGFVELRNKPPSARIVPAETFTVPATEKLAFSAAGSSDPEGADLQYRWTIAGQSPQDATFATCSGETTSALLCQFILPGQFTVAVTVVDNASLQSTAVTTVRVAVPNGYVFLFARSGDEAETRAFRHALLHAVDWPEIQRLYPYRQILLWDPIHGEAVFAATQRRDTTRARQILVEAGFERIGGAKLMVPAGFEEVVAKLQPDLAASGISVSFTPIVAAEVYTAMERGLANSGFIPVSSPEDAARIQKEF